MRGQDDESGRRANKVEGSRMGGNQKNIHHQERGGIRDEEGDVLMQHILPSASMRDGINVLVYLLIALFDHLVKKHTSTLRPNFDAF